MDLTNNWHALLGSSNCSYMYLTYITSHFPNIWHILFAFFVLPGTYVGVGYYVIIMTVTKRMNGSRDIIILYIACRSINNNEPAILINTVHVCIPTPTPSTGKHSGISVHAPWLSLHLIALSDRPLALHKVWSGTGSVFCCPPDIYISTLWFISSTQWYSTMTQLHKLFGAWCVWFTDFKNVKITQ